MLTLMNETRKKSVYVEIDFFQMKQIVELGNWHIAADTSITIIKIQRQNFQKQLNNVSQGICVTYQN